MTLTNILIGLLLIGVGIAALKFNYQLTNSFGSFNMPRFLGTGNEYAIFKLVAIVVMFIGFVIMFGLAAPILNTLLSPLRSLLSAGQ